MASRPKTKITENTEQTLNVASDEAESTEHFPKQKEEELSSFMKVKIANALVGLIDNADFRKSILGFPHGDYAYKVIHKAFESEIDRIMFNGGATKEQLDEGAEKVDEIVNSVARLQVQLINLIKGGRAPQPAQQASSQQPKVKPRKEIIYENVQQSIGDDEQLPILF